MPLLLTWWVAGHAVFDVIVKCSESEWSVTRRFSEFDGLLDGKQARSGYWTLHC